MTFEHDWLIESFLGVRGLREAPGRARAWQEGLDRAAGAHGLTLQWCMASPADFFQTVTLRNVTSIRTSGDYRYVIGNGALWSWFLYGNALARALGLWPFKDVFLSRRDGDGPRDGDPHAEVEALLAALSAGPVGIGDRVGRTDRELVLRTCRGDGVLVKPDVPIAAIDRCFRATRTLEPLPLVARDALATIRRALDLRGRAARVARGRAAALPRRARRARRRARRAARCSRYDWRSGAMRARWRRARGFDARRSRRSRWDYRVLAPLAARRDRDRRRSRLLRDRRRQAHRATCARPRAASRSTCSARPASACDHRLVRARARRRAASIPQQPSKLAHDRASGRFEFCASRFPTAATCRVELRLSRVDPAQRERHRERDRDHDTGERRQRGALADRVGQDADRQAHQRDAREREHGEREDAAEVVRLGGAHDHRGVQRLEAAEAHAHHEHGRDPGEVGRRERTGRAGPAANTNGMVRNSGSACCESARRAVASVTVSPPRALVKKKGGTASAERSSACSTRPGSTLMYEKPVMITVTKKITNSRRRRCVAT